MSIIEGIDQLDTLPSKELQQLENAARIHRDQSNIVFRILTVGESFVEIETVQLETRSGNYAREVSLLKKTHEVFDHLLPHVDIRVTPVPYLPSPTSVVNPLWLEKTMEEKGVRIKQIAFDTGVDRESIADWIAGRRSMSQIVKAMFYFYLSHKTS